MAAPEPTPADEIRQAATTLRDTGIDCWHGGYRCCCWEPWLIRGDRCISGAQHGDPVVDEEEGTQ